MMHAHTLDKPTLEAVRVGIKVLQGSRFAPTDEGHISVLLRYMAPPSGALILDAGCGFGEIARVMKIYRPDLDFVLLNQNSLQLSYAPREFRRIQADFHDIPLADVSVDGVMFCYSLCHANAPRALAEVARITRPGGFLFVYDYDRMGGNNDLFFGRLLANAIPYDLMERLAWGANWHPVMHETPPGDDSPFRSAYANDAEYDTIFQHLVPAVWKAIRV